MNPDAEPPPFDYGAGAEGATPHKSFSSAELSAQADHLQSSLDALSILASAELDLEELLTRVAHYAVSAIPGADGSGLTLLEKGRSNTIVATAPFVSQIDDTQYALMQGPRVSAAATARTVMSGSLGNDQRWPQFGSKVARLGVHSAVSLPLIAGGGVVGAMNVYAHAKHAFDDRAAELGQLFAGPVAVAVQNAQVLAEAVRLTDELRSSLTTRRVIDRAIGILMSRTGTTELDALDRLRAISQREHRKLDDVCRQLIDEAVRRARSRQSES